MSERTSIEWTDSTFNPWIGCTKVSRTATGGGGCDGCYAEVSTPARVLRAKGAETWGPGAPRVRTSDDTWDKPEKWNAKPFYECANCGLRTDNPMTAQCLGQHRSQHIWKPARRRVFCASLADWLDNEVPIEWLVDLLDTVRQTPNLDWLLLTKRIGNWSKRVYDAIVHTDLEREDLRAWMKDWRAGDAPANVWIGATVVNQAEADRDIPKLLAVPARVRFLSMEPLLGPANLRKWLDPWTCADCEFHGSEDDCGPDGCASCGEVDAFANGGSCKSCGTDDQAAKASCPRCGSHRSYERDAGFKFDSERKLIDWVIVGGESGPGARPMHPDWARSLRDQCAAAGVPFLFKQWGEFLPASANEADPVVADVPDSRLFWSDGSKWDRFDGQRAGVDLVARIGKKAAGRLLDGVEHNGFPEAA